MINKDNCFFGILDIGEKFYYKGEYCVKTEFNKAEYLRIKNQKIEIKDTEIVQTIKVEAEPGIFVSNKINGRQTVAVVNIDLEEFMTIYQSLKAISSQLIEYAKVDSSKGKEMMKELLELNGVNVKELFETEEQFSAYFNNEICIAISVLKFTDLIEEHLINK